MVVDEVPFRGYKSQYRTSQVNQIYKLTGVVWLHSLKGVDEETSALDIKRSRRSNNVTLDLATGPEGMSH